MRLFSIIIKIIKLFKLYRMLVGMNFMWMIAMWFPFLMDSWWFIQLLWRVLAREILGFQKWQEPRDVEKKKYEGFLFYVRYGKVKREKVETNKK